LGIHLITYTVTDVNGCTSISTKEIEVTICQAIEGLEENIRITLYPNPAMYYLTITISNTEDMEWIEIFDMLGNKIISDKMNGNSQTELFFDISEIPSGSYLIQIIGNKSVYTEPFIISR